MVVADLSEIRPLAGGYYTVPEALRILRISGGGKVRDWLSGPRPVIRRQYQTDDEVGFWDLIEIRFVEYFRRQNVSLQHIRKAAEKAREQFETAHPFALSNVKFVTDRKQIFAEVARSTGDRELEQLVTGQYNMYEVVEDFLAKGIRFDPSSGLAKSWHPEPIKFPKIVLTPKLAHGRPSIEKIGIPTEAIFLNWRAEGFNFSAVSDWFEIEESDARQAVEYELELGGAGETNR